MSTPSGDEPVRTWNDGELLAEDVIEAADGTGYVSFDDFGSGENGFQPDE